MPLCRGSDAFDQGGYDNGENISTVPLLVTGLTNVRQISCGLWHTCALRTDNTARCW